MINDNYEIICHLPYERSKYIKGKYEQTHETMVNTDTTEFALRKNAFPYANEISLPRVNGKQKGPRLTPFQSFIKQNNDIKRRILEKTHSNKNVNLFLQGKSSSQIQPYTTKDNNVDALGWRNKCNNSSGSTKNAKAEKRICIASPINASYYYTKKRLIMEEKVVRSKSKKNLLNLTNQCNWNCSSNEDIKMFTLDNTNKSKNRIRLLFLRDKEKMIRNNTEKTYRCEMFTKQRRFRFEQRDIRSFASNNHDSK